VTQLGRVQVSSITPHTCSSAAERLVYTEGVCQCYTFSVEIKHGTISGYRRCRCEECRRAKAMYERGRRLTQGSRGSKTPLRDMSEVELAWLAGLLEGEGSFLVVRGAGRVGQSVVRIKITLQMTDRDIVERAHRLTGVGRLFDKLTKQKEYHKNTFIWALSAMESTYLLMKRLLPHMGERRSAQIQVCLTAVDEIGGPESVHRRHNRARYKYEGCECADCVDPQRAV
jgi:hypothetical protein